MRRDDVREKAKAALASAKKLLDEFADFCSRATPDASWWNEHLGPSQTATDHEIDAALSSLDAGEGAEDNRLMDLLRRARVCVGELLALDRREGRTYLVNSEERLAAEIDAALSAVGPLRPEPAGKPMLVVCDRCGGSGRGGVDYVESIPACEAGCDKCNGHGSLLPSPEPAGAGEGVDVERLKALLERVRPFVTGYAVGSEKNVKWLDEEARALLRGRKL